MFENAWTFKRRGPDCNGGNQGHQLRHRQLKRESCQRRRNMERRMQKHGISHGPTLGVTNSRAAAIAPKFGWPRSAGNSRTLGHSREIGQHERETVDEKLCCSATTTRCVCCDGDMVQIRVDLPLLSVQRLRRCFCWFLAVCADDREMKQLEICRMQFA